MQCQQIVNCDHEDKIEDIILESVIRDIDDESINSALIKAMDNSLELFGPIHLATVFFKFTENGKLIFQQDESVNFIATHVDGVVCNRYMIQSNHRESHYNGDDYSKHKFYCNGVGWRTIGNYYDLEKAIESLKNRSNLTRSIWPMRIIDLHDRIYQIYDQEKDMRLPGCRWSKIERDADKLWHQAGCTEGDKKEFKEQAEVNLIMDEGIYNFSEYVVS